MRYRADMQLDDLIPIALAAGREIMATRAAGFATETKYDGSPVTLADRRAEELIERELQRLAPDIPMIGEESVAAGRIPDLHERFFCVDPLDGTRGFAAESDFFTVNIALIEGGEPRWGVICAPALCELYVGGDGKAFTARCNITSGAAIDALTPIRTQGMQSDPLRLVASETAAGDPRTRDLIAELGGAVSHFSSSIKFCRLADGSADLYPRFGEVSEWDAAAGHAILRAAGGDVTRLDGSPLRYGENPSAFLIQGFMAFGSDTAKGAMLRAMKD